MWRVKVSLKRYYFAPFDDGLTLKTLKWAYIHLVFAFKLFIYIFFQKDFDMDVKEAHFSSPLYQHLEKGV